MQRSAVGRVQVTNQEEVQVDAVLAVPQLAVCAQQCAQHHAERPSLPKNELFACP